MLGEARTHVSSSAGRIGNVKLSAKLINGIVLNSGDTFSYNDSVGKRTEARGFKPAPAYVKGETVDEVGGGICQTSSTLYLACLLNHGALCPPLCPRLHRLGHGRHRFVGRPRL